MPNPRIPQGSVSFEETYCPSCYVPFCLPVGFVGERRKDAKSYWCPNGHSLSWRESEADRMRRERDKAIQENARLAEIAEREARWRRDAEEAQKHAEQRANGYKGALAKTKKRVAHGVCPCCKRTFRELEAHMKNEHPDYLAEEVT